MLGLGKVGLGAVGQRCSGNGGDALIGLGPLTLVDQDGEVPLADLAERHGIGHQPVRVETGVGTDAGGLAPFGRAIVIRRDQPRRSVAAHLQRQFPAQLDRLPDQRGQQRHLGHQRLDLGRVVMLLQDTVEHPVQTGDAAADVRGIELKRQDGIVPGNARAKGHGLSLQDGFGHIASIWGRQARDQRGGGRDEGMQA